MRIPRATVASFAAVFLAGCDGADSHAALGREAAREIRELADVVGSIRDRTTLDAAKSKIERLCASIEAVGARRQQLAEPDPEEEKAFDSEVDPARAALDEKVEEVLGAIPKAPQLMLEYESFMDLTRRIVAALRSLERRPR